MRIPAARVYFPREDWDGIFQRLAECLESGQLTLGKNVRELEEALASYVGVKHVVAVNSGTSALEITLRALGVVGKEVLVPTNTFFATPASVLHAGGKVRFVDADPETLSLDVESLKASITPETAGVIIVHIGGMITHRIGEIQDLCRQRGLFLLEDAAHALGSSFRGENAGTFGVASAFSFYPTKVMTSGEGGMLATDDEGIYKEALIYRDQGKPSFSSNYHTHLGYNWRMSEPHAILGLYQLKRLEEFLACRRRIARIYDRELASLPGVRPVQLPEGSVSNYYKYIAYLPKGIDRGKLKQLLREKYEVSLSGEVYEVPCHMQPVFRELAPRGGLPKAEEICSRHICLSVYANMTDEEAHRVTWALGEALKAVG